MWKYIYFPTTTPTSHTHRFHPHPPPSTRHTPTFDIHTLNFAQFKRMDDNCGEWVECTGVASGCVEQEVGVASGSGWNIWVWLLGVVVRRYIDFLILPNPTPLVSVLFLQQHPYYFFTFLIIESVDSISRDERDAPLMQYITNVGISRARYIITHFKHHHLVLWLISKR